MVGYEGANEEVEVGRYVLRMDMSTSQIDIAKLKKHTCGKWVSRSSFGEKGHVVKRRGVCQGANDRRMRECG